MIKELADDLEQFARLSVRSMEPPPWFKMRTVKMLFPHETRLDPTPRYGAASREGGGVSCGAAQEGLEGAARGPAPRGRAALSFGTVCGTVWKRDAALRRKLLQHNRAPVAQVDRAAAF